MHLAVVLLLGAAAGGCRSASSVPVPDASLGLAKGSVFDVPTPPAVKAADSAPGQTPVVPRPYATAPPQIPHAVGDFLPITQKQNLCLECHAIKDKKQGEPTPIPASHYTDYRNAPDQVGSQVVGARYVCVSCHAGKTDAPPLVGNSFSR
jgi:cytochrome c-type protein NapB